MRTITLLAVLAGAPPGMQDEKAVAAAAQATMEKGTFTLQVTPVTDLKDALPQDRAVVAGVPVAAEQLKDGLFHATDGTTEIWGRDKLVFIKTREGWTAATDVVAGMIAEITAAAGKDEWRRRNVTQAKATFRRLLGLAQLASRSMPPTKYLTQLETDFKGFKKGATEVIDGKRCQIYQGEMKPAAAQLFLQGPYEWLVKEGTLVISETTGVGRVWVTPDGLVRRTDLRAAGKYTVLNKDENTRKTSAAAIVVTADILKVGETKLDAPREVTDKIAAADAANGEK